MGKRDLNLKVYLEDPRRYADMVNAGIFRGRQMVKADELTSGRTVTTKADKEVAVETTSDIVMKQSVDGELFAIWVLENQEKIDYSMPVRVMLKEALEYDRQVKKIKKKNRKEGTGFSNEGEFLYRVKKTDKVFPIHTLVVYWGQETWDGPKSLHEFIDFTYDDPADIERIKQITPEYPLLILDLSQEQDYSVFRTELKTVFELYSLRESKEKLYDYVENHEECDHLDEETYQMIGILVNEDHLLNKAEEYKNEKGEIGMCKAIRELMEDAREEGREEGREEELISIVNYIRAKLECELEEACEIIGKSVEEYKRAQK